MNSNNNNVKPLDASFSALCLSTATNAALLMGLTPHPETGTYHKDPVGARFSIDLLLLLKEKTKGNLTSEEDRLLDSLIHDLQLKFVQTLGKH